MTKPINFGNLHKILSAAAKVSPATAAVAASQ